MNQYQPSNWSTQCLWTPGSAEDLIDAFYILSSATPRVLAALIRRDNARTIEEEVFRSGYIEGTMVLTSERRQIEDPIPTISHPECVQCSSKEKPHQAMIVGPWPL